MDSDNLLFLEELYKKYESDPSSIAPSWQNYFSTLDLPLNKPEAASDCRIHHLIDAYRRYGHLAAQINPIAIKPIGEPQELDLQRLGFNENELHANFPTFGLLENAEASLSEIIQRLRTIYCGSVGIEYPENAEIKNWLIERIESNQLKPKLTIEQKHMILQQLNRSELFESFIHTRYTGQKRFSLEGGETLIPMLEATVETGNQLGLEQFIIGMAHRGRLNVLSNILNKSHADIFSEFEDNYIPDSFEGSGDVKYHKGFYSEVTTPIGTKVKINLAPNPSHLESVDAVVEGQVKAKQRLLNDAAQKKVIPILIHGDAALSGQGVVYETLQFSVLAGYATGGTLHFVINNQIGFTALPAESRSTCYCTDIGKAFDTPIFHLNAEDPESCVYITNLAVELRQKFHCDVFIDLNCYRKYGHNESDEPAYTQPLEYQVIRKKRPIRELYRDQLIQQGVLEQQLAENLEKDFTEGLQKAHKQTKESAKMPSAKTEKESEKVVTKVPYATLKLVAEKISNVPQGFNIHPKLKNLVQERLAMVVSESKPLDWGMAELLAYGTILLDKSSVRLSGQDSSRGTFSHRHAKWVDQTLEKNYYPLSHLSSDQGQFEVINSPLSEYSTLGFEFGYSCADTEALVIWEAQFGDFCNGAQIIIDQYISTAEQKWGQKFNLVLFLPHGYEGQGPEHSSARMERFLTLCGHDNMRVVNPTTPAQFFHLLRRQVLSPIKKPLIVFTPKGLLRHPSSVSTVKELTEGAFEEIIFDSNDSAVELALCSGRIYFDLIAERDKRKASQLAIVRVEQLYPLNSELLGKLVKNYKKVYWVQEEPQNMGAWGFIHPLINELLPEGKVKYVGRERSASPAVGSHTVHKKQHADLMSALFDSKE